MKTKMRHLIVGGVVGILTLSACNSNENLYDPTMEEKLLKEEYRVNFIENFGKFDADYSWDATSAYPRYKATRASIYEPKIEEEWYEVEEGTLTWLNTKLKEKDDNRKLGSSFIMTVPNNKFTIVPIYQGQAGMAWELYMVVDTQETKIWSKSEGIQYKKKDKETWTWKDLKTDQNTVGVEAVRAKRYTFDLTSLAGETMYFYLKVTKGLDNYATTGTKQSSLQGMMLALQDCPRPGNIDKNNEVMIIGCEDANLRESDWDLNDIVFLVYGNPDVPQPIEIINNEVKEITTKRYMIEDLGSTEDFDFNDIVVDVTWERTKKITTENGVVTKEEYDATKEKQEAVLRHLGGTLPFTLTIGDTPLEEMQGQMNVNPDKQYQISGWDPKVNNITVKVKEGSNEGIHDIQFPGNGEIPMIIAVDPEVEWMKERVSITKEWFDSIKK